MCLGAFARCRGGGSFSGGVWARNRRRSHARVCHGSSGSAQRRRRRGDSSRSAGHPTAERPRNGHDSVRRACAAARAPNRAGRDERINDAPSRVSARRRHRFLRLDVSGNARAHVRVAHGAARDSRARVVSSRGTSQDRRRADARDRASLSIDTLGHSARRRCSLSCGRHFARKRVGALVVVIVNSIGRFRVVRSDPPPARTRRYANR